MRKKRVDVCVCMKVDRRWGGDKEKEEKQKQNCTYATTIERELIGYK